MEPNLRAEVQRSLRGLAQVYTAALKLLEDAQKLLDEEPPPQPPSHLPKTPDYDSGNLVNIKQLSVCYQGKSCFLGNSLSFWILARLAREPNAYVSHEDLVTEIWRDEFVSSTAIRSAVKTLRNRLRQHDLAALADAIDGSVRGHYVLRLDL